MNEGRGRITRRPAGAAGVKVVSILSGKGGVGKSVFALNLAERLTALGARVLLVDADLHFGSIAILANVETGAGFGEYVRSGVPLERVVTATRHGFDVVAGGETEPTEPDVTAVARAMERLRREAERYDLVLVDHSSGVSEAAIVMAHASDVNLLVLVPEITSISDGYGLYKHLQQIDSNIDCRLVVNRVLSGDEAEFIETKFLAVCQRFLGHVPGYAGKVGEDSLFRRAVASQTVLARLEEQSFAVEEVTSIARHLLGVFGGAVSKGAGDAENSGITINKTPAMADIRE
ncbi:MAG: P-loop NTPase [Candidatus Zixiibacteriota bacterium]|nr:MAG: P-loop NTPase [candidate division Zixibacteria bacterium]